MTKADVFLIISQIYIMGALISEKNRSLLNLFAAFWFILSLITWGLQ